MNKTIEERVLSREEATKIWGICYEYACKTHNGGWTWQGAIKFIQDNWSNPEYNVENVDELDKED